MLQRTRSQFEPGIWRGKARDGRAGQAFALVESGVVDRATANSSLPTATGHKQGDQAAKTKPPAGSRSRILDQSLGPTRARSSRNRPLESPSTMAGFARGWAGRSPPVTPKPTHFASNTRSPGAPGLTYRDLVTGRSNRGLCSCDSLVLQ